MADVYSLIHDIVVCKQRCCKCWYVLSVDDPIWDMNWTMTTYLNGALDSSFHPTVLECCIVDWWRWKVTVDAVDIYCGVHHGNNDQEKMDDCSSIVLYMWLSWFWI